ncbi:MAG: response regulator [Spirochaetales bacterium]|nr:response regulator [Spirochaetales bacterium]
MDEEKKPNLLLIDDEEPFCTVNVNILKLAGYNAVYALSAEEGLEHVEKNPDVDVILLDIDLGDGLKGTEALPMLLKTNPAIQVIMITSNRDINIGVDCMKKGAFDYLTKPFQRQNLLRVIAGAVERKKIIQLKNLYLEILVHDLKNPIQNISMGLDALDVDDEQLRKKAYNLASFGCWQIKSMVNNILRITQFEKTTPILDITEVTLNEREITNEITSLMEQITFTGRDFEILFHGKNEYTVKTEKSLFYQIISNLLSNAIRFTKKGDKITVELKEKENQTLLIGVSNTGSFIEKDMRDMIFDKFYKPRFSGKHQGRNFGLGLTFCKYAVIALGGELWVESYPDPAVTSFFFTIKTT